jgi:hypothetical protein
MAIAFVIAYFGFLVGYPLLQLWTLFRCRGWWRAFSSFCLIPAIPLYAWALATLLHPRSDGDLSSLLVAPLAVIPNLYVIAVGLGFEMMRWRNWRALHSGDHARIDGTA